MTDRTWRTEAALTGISINAIHFINPYLPAWGAEMLTELQAQGLAGLLGVVCFALLAQRVTEKKRSKEKAKANREMLVRSAKGIWDVSGDKHVDKDV